MHEICPNLWLGSLRAATDQAALAQRGITHVLSVGLPEVQMRSRQRKRIPASAEDPLSLERLVICEDDASSSRLDRHFEASCEFIAEGLVGEGAVLVHCVAGQSRSCTLVVAYLMREEKWPLQAALDFVKQRRLKVQPNIGFMDQLRSYELTLGIDPSKVVECSEATLERTSSTESCEDSLSPTASEDTPPSSPLSSVSRFAPLPRVGVAADDEADAFNADASWARCAKLRARFSRLKTPQAISGIPAPLRKRRHM